MSVTHRELTLEGAAIELLVGPHEPRQALLRKHNFPVPPPVRLAAQIDPGTGISGVDAGVLRDLGLTPIDTIQARTPAAAEAPVNFERSVVSISLAAEDGKKFLPLVLVIGCAFGPEENVRAMLGRAVLEHCLFVYDGRANRYSLGF